MPETGKHIEIWNECLDIISRVIEPQPFATWFKPVRSVSLVDSKLTIEVPSNYFMEYLESAYLDVLTKTLKRVIGPDAKLSYTFRPVKNQPGMTVPSDVVPTPENKPMLIQGQPSENPGPFVYPGLYRVKINPRLNPVYRFDNFVEGECNKLGRSAGESIAAAPGKTPFNPLMIFGGSGLGKTHLAQAIGISIKQSFPDLVVLYVTGNEFKTQYMDAVSVHNKLTDFLAYYMRIDVLIVDDIQDLLGQGSQTAFFNVFNRLHQSGKQLIFTSDRAPADLQNFEERLLSRFKWGLSVPLGKPDYSTRLRMLQLRSEREGADIPNDVLDYLATRITGNFRELEGALISLVAYSTIDHGKSLMEHAEIIADKIVGQKKSDLSIDKVQKTVCDYFNITREDFLSKSRKRQIVQSRQISMYLCRNMISGCSLASIGAQTGGKDHATVLHACTTVSDLMATDRLFKKYVADIEQMLASSMN